MLYRSSTVYDDGDANQYPIRYTTVSSSAETTVQAPGPHVSFRNHELSIV